MRPFERYCGGFVFVFEVRLLCFGFCEWQRDPVCALTLIVCVKIILEKSPNSLVFGV